MNLLTKEEQKLTNKFLKNGFIVKKIESRKSLTYLSNFVKKELKFFLKKKINLNLVHKELELHNLNELRLFIFNKINENKYFKFHYFNLAKKLLYTLVGNELMMQKNINLSIQLPFDKSSLLPIHSDVWSGDSSYEINLWVPLVDCYDTKSMYILKPKDYDISLKKIKNKIYESDTIYKIVKKKLRWLKVDYGQCLIFNQCLPHGNVVNMEKETRWSMNCRFKTIFSPYKDKKVGEFFQPITLRAMTTVGNNYQDPFKKKL